MPYILFWVRCLCVIVVLAGVLLASSCGSEPAASSAGRIDRPDISSNLSLGRVAFLRPELARIAIVVSTRWRREGYSTAFRSVPRRFGSARIALSTGTPHVRVTVYLYDSAGEASRIRLALRRGRHPAHETRTAGFCLYVGASRLAPSRFARLFDVAEARGHNA